MKKFFKNYLKLGILLFLISLVFTNCEKDDDFTTKEPTVKQAQTVKYTTSIVQKTTFNINENLKLALNKFKAVDKSNVLNNASKLVINDSLNIAIEDGSAKYLESLDGSYHSYTFVAFDYGKSQGMQNIVLSLQLDGTYKEFLIYYDLTDSEIESYRNNEYVNLLGKVTIVALEGSSLSGNSFSKLTVDDNCLEWDITEGSNCTDVEGHSWEDGNACPHYLTTTQTATPDVNNFLGINWPCVEASNGGSYIPGTNSNNPSNGTQSGAGQPGTSAQQDVSSGYAPTPKQQREKGFQKQLSDEANDCFNSANLTDDQREEIMSFLEAGISVSIDGGILVGNQGSYNQSDIDFAEQATLAMCAGGEVDFDDNIIYDNSLNDYPCHKLIIEEAIGTCSPLTQLVLDLFESNDGSNLIIRTEDLGPANSSSNANTTSTSTYNPVTNTCDITITFNENYLDAASDISLARTAIHESLHAILIYMFEQDLLYSYDGSPMGDFEDFVNNYINYQLGLPANIGVAHHQLLVDFVEDIALSLSTYSLQNGYANNGFNYYKKMSWAGLTTMESFLLIYPKYLDPADEANNQLNFNPEWLDIKLTIQAEKYNETQIFPHPNGFDYEFIPKGTSPNETEPCN
ncbi:hypothetical protein [Lacinutrix jangbogonensis]|uniref:hypothetical protein n=1 Tax=Lacinutrix jangbogonensis TaxID=1469557 RepID=UPI00053E7C10|nr:hypothetical protein [Lacinutrix jangbogonensis]